MATDQLTATSSSSPSQATAQADNPQPTGQAGDSGAKSASLQPGTATSLLSNGPAGVPLHGTSLSTVSLASPAAAPLPLATTTAPAQPRHHGNPALLGFPALLVLLALVLFWTTKRSVKSTT